MWSITMHLCLNLRGKYSPRFQEYSFLPVHGLHSHECSYTYKKCPFIILLIIIGIFVIFFGFSFISASSTCSQNFPSTSTCIVYEKRRRQAH